MTYGAFAYRLANLTALTSAWLRDTLRPDDIGAMQEQNPPEAIRRFLAEARARLDSIERELNEC